MDQLAVCAAMDRDSKRTSSIKIIGLFSSLFPTLSYCLVSPSRVLEAAFTRVCSILPESRVAGVPEHLHSVVVPDFKLVIGPPPPYTSKSAGG